MRRPVIAIDGPAGAGKSSVARLLAERLGYVYIDTGAMYRAVAHLAKQHGVSWDDEPALAELCRSTDMRFVPTSSGLELEVNGQLPGLALRTPEAGQGASRVSVHPRVREQLVECQRRMGSQGGVVMEGRDIGTVVFPQAGLKVFLTASVEERARRRAGELRSRGMEPELARIQAEVTERDARDCQRDHSPLRQAEDAVLVSTDGLTLEQVIDQLVHLARDREVSG